MTLDSLPLAIENDEELDHLTDVLLDLDESDSPEDQLLAEALTVLIEKYEAEHYSLPEAI